MDDFVMPLLLGLDVSSLTMSLVNIASAGGAEASLADSVEAALRTVVHLQVDRVGDTVVARTDTGHPERVVVAAHLDTAPGEPLARVEMGRLYGPGASDAKGALATTLRAAAVGGFCRDVTFVYYAGGRADAGLTEDLLRADFALLAEPTGAAVVGETLDHPWTRQLIELSEVDPAAGTADTHGLARAESLGVPVVAFGPGDASLAGTPDEFVPTAQLTQCEFVLRQWLTTRP